MSIRQKYESLVGQMHVRMLAWCAVVTCLIFILMLLIVANAGAISGLIIRVGEWLISATPSMALSYFALLVSIVVLIVKLRNR